MGSAIPPPAVPSARVGAPPTTRATAGPAGPVRAPAPAPRPGSTTPTVQSPAYGPASPPPTPVDWRTLFTAGALSPRYPAQHRGSGAERLEPVDDAHNPVLELLFNPALAFSGKTSARIEIAPFEYHAFFVEGSLLAFDVNDQKVTGKSLDFGYHLFPFGHRLRGFYIGPRYLIGKGQGETTVLQTTIGDVSYRVRGTMKGVGGDLGVIFVFGPLCINLGGGVGTATVVSEPDPAVPLPSNLPANVQKQIPARVEQNVVIPVITAGLGLAFLSRTR